jgi:hypothetical protein
MNSSTINSLLKERGAWLKSIHGDVQQAKDHADLSRMIAGDYQNFEKVRDRIFKSTEDFMRHVQIEPSTLNEQGHALVNELEKHGMVIRQEQYSAICEVKGRRYLSGGWLEELAWLAAMEAGADEAIFGQVLGWQVKGYTTREQTYVCFLQSISG